ncbi:glycosyltransferase family 10 [Sulfurovum sp. XTW-4]|uniref:Glycosyltransferase family 10 n=1 Tax=Sulfurovum xiamenensis TaxID=3019066 RepID=A0ABT7QPC7_9BACT|nr:glycosyltransferase family 10 [Sulfurovum xiamenensis]MDM5262926.1 glycosyltransferase family 10 [Sulfurovum xiamenensis]
MKKGNQVKLVNRGSLADENSGFKNQSRGNEAKWESSSFTFNPLEKDYDWLVIIDDVPRIVPNGVEQLSCPKENTILVTTEPSTITMYGKAFTGQFHYVITNQDEKALPHPNAIRSQTGNVWFYGKSLDEILAVKEPTKTKKISTVCSNKQQGHTIHKLRYEFTKIMEERIPELERFGRGFKWIETKAEAIDDYEFHVAIENHYAPHVWTEKLADTFLGYAVPIYFGCPNIYDYFPEESLILIDIYDVEGSIEKIKKIISTPGEYERRLPAVKEARRRVIEEYNLLAMINNIVENAKEDKSLDTDYKIYNRRMMRVRHLPDLIRFAFWKINNFIKNI